MQIKGGRRHTSIEDSVDTSIRRLEDYIKKKNEKRLITAISNNTRIKRTTLTRKQKWDEIAIVSIFQAENKRNLTREDLDMAKKGKPQERN